MESGEVAGGGLVAETTAAALLTIADLGAYIPLVDPVVDALPSSFRTVDAGFVDAWYTLARETTGAREGAGGNGRFAFDRYRVQALWPDFPPPPRRGPIRRAGR